MRRALGLGRPAQGAAAKPRSATGQQTPDRPKRRFVQDGEVPVTLVHALPDRRAGLSPSPASQSPPAPGVAELEAALAAERAARERAERSLREAQATIHALQTRLGHAELARVEALETAKADSAVPDAPPAAEAGPSKTRSAPAAKVARRRSAPKPREPKPVKWWIKT